MRQCRADRMEHAKRFRAMLADFGLPHPEAAKLLHVSLRTLQNWLSGRHEVPYAAYKLVRLLRYMELPGDGWKGWHFAGGLLVTPEGRTIGPGDGSWWSLLVRQARCFQTMYRRSGQLERALMELAAQSGRPLAEAVQASAHPAPSKAQPEGAARSAANLFIGHFRTQMLNKEASGIEVPGNVEYPAINNGADNQRKVSHGGKGGYV